MVASFSLILVVVNLNVLALVMNGITHLDLRSLVSDY